MEEAEGEYVPDLENYHKLTEMQKTKLSATIMRLAKKYGEADTVKIWWTDPSLVYDYGEYGSGPPPSLMVRILINRVPTRWKWKTVEGTQRWIRVH